MPQYSCLGNPMGREAWRAAVHGVAQSWTRLSTDHTINLRDGMKGRQKELGHIESQQEGCAFIPDRPATPGLRGET